MFNLIGLFIFIFGLIIGSFLNCLIWRLRQSESLLGRSYCPKCRAQIAWYDNIPLLSYLLLRGQCRHCEQKIAGQYPLVELITALLFAATWWQLGVGTGDGALNYWLIAKYLMTIFIMTVIFVYDWRWLEVPVYFIGGGGLLLLIVNIFLKISVVDLVLAVLIALLFFGGQYILTRRRGLGVGDIWIGVLMAIIFPRPGLILTALFISYVGGGIIAVILLAIQKKGLKSKLPLGVFLAGGTIIALFYGSQLLTWYLGRLAI